MLFEGENNFIASVFMDKNHIGVSFCDISTGEIHACKIGELNIDRLANELFKFSPKEILLNKTAYDNRQLKTFIENRLSCNRELLDRHKEKNN
jgi:DNA mismatch repair protein MutS